MKKNILTFIVINLAILGAFGQEKTFGLMGGGTYYNGELNPRMVFTSPGFTGGILFRHNFPNNRVSLRFNANYIKIQGADSLSKNTYQLRRNHSFVREFWDLGMQVEMNFLKFDPEAVKKYYFTPYLSAGLVYMIMPTEQGYLNFGVPIALGMKYAVTPKFVIGLEWSYRWTLQDEMDDLQDDNFQQNLQKQMSHNPDADWYSLARVFFTFRLSKRTKSCPAYSY